MNFNRQYLSLIQKVLTEGDNIQTRNSMVKQIFCPGNITLDIRNDFPILSVRKIPFYKAALETLFFLSGKNSYKSMPKTLRNSWWKPWSETAKRNDSWGKFYGAQWRHQSTDCTTGKHEFDQYENLIQQLVEVVKTRVVNRKMVVSLWNGQQSNPEYTSDPAVLESCHSTSLIFNLVPHSRAVFFLDLHHVQRSLDLMCGTGSDLIYSGLLMAIISQEVEKRISSEKLFVIPRKLVFSPSNTHIYEAHLAQAKQLLLMNSGVSDYKNVRLTIKEPITNFSFFQTIEDVKTTFEIANYEPQEGAYSFELLG